MTYSAQKPGLVRIVQADYWCLASLIAPFFIFVTGTFTYLLTPKEVGPFLVMEAIALLVAPIVLIWRVRHIERILANGIEVNASFQGSSFHKGSSQVKFTYPFQGMSYTGKADLMNTGRTLALVERFQAGEPIVLIVERDNPRQTLLRDLYFDRKQG